MKNKFFIGLACFAVMAAAIVTVTTINANTPEFSDLLTKNLEARTRDEITIVELEDQKNNVESCQTEKEIVIDLGNGNKKVEFKTVSGIKNDCRNIDGTCDAFACYAN